MDAEDQEFWEETASGIQATSDARDRTIVTLSSTALGASIALSQVLFETPVSLWAIGVALGLFGLSAVAALLSMEAAEAGHWSVIQEMQAGADRFEAMGRVRWQKATWRLNRVAVWGFVLGMAAITWFAWANLEGE